MQIHSSLHSPLTNRQGPTNRPAKPARKKPSVLATGTSPMRQPESEAPALPTEHPEAVTSSRTGRMDSLNLICPSGDWDKNRKANTWCSSVGYLNHKSDWMTRRSISFAPTAQFGNTFVCSSPRARYLVLLVTSALDLVTLAA